MISAYELTIEQTILRGDTWDGLNFVVTRTGTDYTGATIKAEFRNAPDGAIQLTKNITPSVAAMNTTTFDVGPLTKEETAKMNTKVLFADVEITTAVDRKTPILIKFQIEKDITKP